MYTRHLVKADPLIKLLESAIQRDEAELGNFIFEFVEIPSENPAGPASFTRP